MSLSYSNLFNKSWDVIKDQLPLVAGLTLVYWVGALALSMVPVVGGFLSGPFTAGYMRCLMRIRDRQEIGYEDVFWGFMNLNRLAQLLVLGLIVGVLTVLGFIFLVVPGIWFAVASSLATAYLVLADTDAVTALKKSLAAVKGQWFEVFVLLLILGCLFVAGALCFILGLLVTTPLAVMMLLQTAESLAGKTGAPTTPAPHGPSVINVNPS